MGVAVGNTDNKRRGGLRHARLQPALVVGQS